MLISLIDFHDSDVVERKVKLEYRECREKDEKEQV